MQTTQRLSTHRPGRRKASIKPRRKTTITHSNHGAQAVSGFPGEVPQQDATYAQRCYEQPAIEALARQNGAGNNEMQAHQYAQQATQYQQDVPTDASTRQPHYSQEDNPAEQHSEMLQQGL